MVSLDKKIVDAIILQDQIKDNALSTIQTLKENNIEVVMVTDDSKTSALFFGQKLGISNIFSDILPANKTRIIQDFKNQGKVVAMVVDASLIPSTLAEDDIGITAKAIEISLIGVIVYVMYWENKIRQIML